MEIGLRANWFRLPDGRSVNPSHCDLLDIVADDGAFRVLAWDALQPSVEAYELRRFADRGAAEAWLLAFVEAMAEVGARG